MNNYESNYKNINQRTKRGCKERLLGIKQLNIMENKRLLAEFIGMKPHHEDSSIMISKQYGNNITIHLSELEFDTDWNWLMQVVDKIESLEHWVEILGGLQKTCLIGSTNSSNESFKNTNENKIDAVYNACVEFVKWYNKQKK